MFLVIDGIYDYGGFSNVCLVMCDITKNIVRLKDKHGNCKEVYLDLFRAHGKLVKPPASSNKNYAVALEVLYEWQDSKPQVLGVATFHNWLEEHLNPDKPGCA